MMVGCGGVLLHVGWGDSHCALDRRAGSRRCYYGDGDAEKGINDIVSGPVKAGLTGARWTWEGISWPHPGQGMVSMTEVGSLEPRPRAQEQSRQFVGFMVRGRHPLLDNTISKEPHIGHRLSQDLESSVTFY